MKYRYFVPIDAINEWIRCKDVEALQGVLVGIINCDPTFATKEYEEALDYITNRGNVDIYDERGNVKLPGEYEVGDGEWDEKYYRMLLAWLSQNYTKERLEHVKQVGAKVYRDEYTQGKDEARHQNDKPKGHSKFKKSRLFFSKLGQRIYLASKNHYENLKSKYPKLASIWKVIMTLAQKFVKSITKNFTDEMYEEYEKSANELQQKYDKAKYTTEKQVVNESFINDGIHEYVASENFIYTCESLIII